MRDCTALKRLRDWVRKLLTVLTGAADDLRTDAQVARVLVYGRYEKDSPVVTAVRGAALDAIRASDETASGCPECCPGCPGCPELSRAVPPAALWLAPPRTQAHGVLGRLLGPE